MSNGKVFVRAGFPFNYDVRQAGRDSAHVPHGASRTVQSAAKECDINTIVKRFHLTGQLPQGLAVPKYQDFDGVFDFQSAMNVVRQAAESFMKLPADIRARFHNDPQEFLEFHSKPENAQEVKEMGVDLSKDTGSPAGATSSPAAAGGASPAPKGP